MIMNPIMEFFESTTPCQHKLSEMNVFTLELDNLGHKAFLTDITSKQLTSGKISKIIPLSASSKEMEFWNAR